MKNVDFIDNSNGLIIESVNSDNNNIEHFSCLIEGMTLFLEVEKPDAEENESERKKRLYCYLTKAIRAESGMIRVEFSEWLGIPYRTMQEWEIGRRLMPDYLLRLIAFKVNTAKKAGNIGNK